MIKIKEEKVLSDNWYILKKYTYEYQLKDGSVENHSREVYDRGNGATVLLINPQDKKIILTKQFRLPSYLNGNADGMMIETCAGLLDGASPEDCVKRESEEETGYRVKNVRKLFQLFMSPGAVTETIHFFVGEYDSSSKISEGGGLASETEYIEVLEYSFDTIIKMVEGSEIKDAKTLILLQHALLKKLIY